MGPEGQLEDPGSEAEERLGPPDAGPRRLPGSISRRVTLSVMGVSILTLVVVGLLFYGFLGRYVIETQKGQLLDQAEVVAQQVAAVEDAFPAMGMMRGPRALLPILRVDLQGLPPGAGIVVYGPGEAVAVAGPAWLQQPAILERLRVEAGTLVADDDTGVSDLPAQGEDQRLIIAAARAQVPNAGDGVVLLVLPASEAVSGRGGLVRVLLTSALIGLGLALLVGLGLGAWLARPIRRLAASASAMAAGRYDTPVSGDFTGEVYDLAAGMETMRREVRRSEESLRAFVASAAHELRTPLTSITGFSQALLDGTAAAEASRDRAAAAIYREAERLRRLVDALLTLSRYDSRDFTPRKDRVSLTALVEEETRRLVEAGVAPEGLVRVQASSPAELSTDPDMLRQVIANLLKNAVTYGDDEEVLVEVERTNGDVTLDVTNGGAPLRPEEREQVFERFYRGDAARSSEGFGLGLPLVKEIVEVLGGEVEVLPATSRTTFRVTLPEG